MECGEVRALTDPDLEGESAIERCFERERHGASCEACGEAPTANRTPASSLRDGLAAFFLLVADPWPSGECRLSVLRPANLTAGGHRGAI